jgi:hypothetical protein
VENTRSFVSPEQIKTWCAIPGTRVVVKPVIDLTGHVHTDAAIKGNGGIVRLENAGTHLVTADQVRAWCGVSTGSTDRVTITVKPVIDLNENIATTAYEVPDRLSEQIDLRDPRRVLGSDATPSLRSCDEELHQARSAA